MSGLSPHEPFLVTFFTDHAAGRKYETMVELEDLARRVRMMNGSSKATLPWLKFARFGDKKTAKGSLRHDQNMISISGIEADYDGEIMSFGQAYDLARSAGLLCLVYTSPSHSEDGPRWRVLCPLSREYTPDERDRFLGRLNGLFGGMFAPESWTLSQSYYYGSVNHNPSHRAEVARGEPIDLLDALDTGAIGRPVKSKTNGATHHGPATPPEAITDKRVNGLIQKLLGHISGAPDGQKYFMLRDTAFTVGGYLWATDWTVSQAVEACVAALPAAKDWVAARKTAQAAIEAGRDKPLQMENRPNPNARTNGAHPPEEDIWARDIPPIELPEPEAEAPVAGEPPVPPGGEPPTPEGGGPGQPIPDGQTTIVCVAGELPRMVRQAEEALSKVAEPIYQRGVLVRPAVVEYDAATPSGSTIKRKTHAASLVEIKAPAMLLMLSRAAIWIKYDGRSKSFKACDPPEKLVDIILARRGEWSFPVIRGILTTPTIRSDGTLLTAPGYDPESRYFLSFPSNLVLPEIPDAPTRADAEASLARLDALLDGYEFLEPDTGVYRAVALVILMTQVLRCGMQVSPMLAVSATAPGSGKSHLVDLAATIATGRWCPIMNAGKDDNETEKGLTTKLMSGVPGFSIDNVHKRLDLEALNTATERPLLQPRNFGTLTDVLIENGAVIYMTGNNLEVIDEQIRRTMMCKMDVAEEQPEQRDFPKGDPINTVLADRGRYIADVLVITRAYLAYLAAGGKKPDIRSYGSYPEWDIFVRQPVVWLGETDPLDSQKPLRADDPAKQRRASIIEAWREAFPKNEPITLAEVVRFASTPPRYDDPGPHAPKDVIDATMAVYQAEKETQENLRDALREAFPVGRDGINTVQLAGWLRRFASRKTDGWRIVKAEEDITANKHKGGVHWKLQKVS